MKNYLAYLKGLSKYRGKAFSLATISASVSFVKKLSMRDRGRLGNEGRPIALKIVPRSRHVDLCDMPKFQVQRPFFSRVLDFRPSGVPGG